MRQSPSPQPLNDDEPIVENAEDESTTSEPTSPDLEATHQLYFSLGKQTHRLFQLESSNDRLHHALTESHQRLADAIAEKLQLQANVQEYKDAIEASEVEIGELSGEIAKLKDMNELALENARLKQEIGEQEALIMELRETGDALVEERAWRTEKDQENKELREELKGKVKAITALERENEMLKGSLNKRITSTLEDLQAIAPSRENRQALQMALINQVKAVVEPPPPDLAEEVYTLVQTLSKVLGVMSQDNRDIERLEKENARYQARRSEALSLLKTIIEAAPTRGTKEAAMQSTSDGGKVFSPFGKGEGTEMKPFEFRFSSSARSGLPRSLYPLTGGM